MRSEQEIRDKLQEAQREIKRVLEARHSSPHLRIDDLEGYAHALRWVLELYGKDD